MKNRKSEWMVWGLGVVGAILIAGLYGLGTSPAQADVVVPTEDYYYSGHHNEVLSNSGWGWGNLNGALVPRQIETSGHTWWEGGQVHWILTGYVYGGFMPRNAVTAEMAAYNLLGEQKSGKHLTGGTVFYTDEGGGDWEISFSPSLDVSIDLRSRVDHYTWPNDGNPIDFWSGGANASINASRGLIQSDFADFQRTDYADGRPSEWWAQFDFSGVMTPNGVTFTAVPEPASAALLGAAGVLFRRRR